MKLVMTAALALNILAAGPPLVGSDLDRAVLNYRAILAGQRQLVDLTIPERTNVIKLDQWIRSQQALVSSETKEQCEARLSTQSPSSLEQALLDLKCSQRPSGSPADPSR